jgi:asparagine synthase (glutamine-hydrolysing)
LRHGLLFKIIKRFPEGTAYYDHSLIKKIKLFTALDKRVSRDPHDIYSAFFTEEEQKILLNLPLHEEVFTGEEHPRIFSDEALGEEPDLGWIERMMQTDLFHYLPDDILTKVDRASMAHALEVRSPFMDYRIVEFAARLPLKHKLRRLTTKYLLRKAFASDLPSEPLKRPKHGFAVPLGDGFHGPLKTIYKELVLSQNQPDWVNRKEAQRLLSEHLTGRIDHGHKLWLLLFLHAWYLWWRE